MILAELNGLMCVCVDRTTYPWYGWTNNIEQRSDFDTVDHLYAKWQWQSWNVLMIYSRTRKRKV